MRKWLLDNVAPFGPVGTVISALIAFFGFYVAAKYYTSITKEVRETAKHSRKLETAKLTYEIGDLYLNYIPDYACVKWCVLRVGRSKVDGQTVDADPTTVYQAYATYVFHTENAIAALENRLDAAGEFLEAYEEKTFSEYVGKIDHIVQVDQADFLKIFRRTPGNAKVWTGIHRNLPPDDGFPVDVAGFRDWVANNQRKQFNPLPGSKCRVKCAEVANHVLGTVPANLFPATTAEAKVKK